jgi:hypothetical protein
MAQAQAVVDGKEDEFKLAQRSQELQDSSGVSKEQADKLASNEAMLARLQDLQGQKDSARGSDVIRASSMAAIGGGGGVYSAGLDYDRQLVDINRQQVELLRQIAANGGGGLFD